MALVKRIGHWCRCEEGETSECTANALPLSEVEGESGGPNKPNSVLKDELLKEIRRDSRFQNLPVIVCSSRSSEKHQRRAREAGANGYLTKPFTQETLAATLRECRELPDPATGPAPLPGPEEPSET